EPSRAHVFHVTFPKTWTSEHLNQFFSPFGMIHISWINDTKAWVSLNDRSQADRATKILGKKSSKLAEVTVVAHAQFQASFVSPTTSLGSRAHVSSSLAATKRKLLHSNGQGQEDGGLRNKKQRLSSTNHSGTVSEKNAKVSEVSQLEAASAKPSNDNFPVDDNWG
ncbi:hypothetical protein GE061_006134, partial [Apolygus lucorum]